jgi:hypothetical protein
VRLSPLGLAALELAQEVGFRVFPLVPRGKMPLIPKTDDGTGGFHGATTHPEQIAAWWDAAPDANVGLYPGASQVIVLDADSGEGERTAEQLEVLQSPTLCAKTARGWHLYYRLPDGERVTNASPWKRQGLDVRAHNGYVLAPPSIHPSGHPYRWLGDFDAIAPVPRAVLEGLRALPAIRIAPPVLSAWQSDDEHTARRFDAYAARAGFAGLSDGRKTAAFQLGCFLLHDPLALSEASAWPYLVTWNARNAPPLSERKLTEIFRNARKYGGRRVA